MAMILSLIWLEMALIAAVLNFKDHPGAGLWLARIFLAFSLGVLLWSLLGVEKRKRHEAAERDSA